MNLSTVIRTMIEAGCTQAQLLAIAEADERAREQREARKRAMHVDRQQRYRARTLVDAVPESRLRKSAYKLLKINGNYVDARKRQHVEIEANELIQNDIPITGTENGAISEQQKGFSPLKKEKIPQTPLREKNIPLSSQKFSSKVSEEEQTSDDEPFFPLLELPEKKGDPGVWQTQAAHTQQVASTARLIATQGGEFWALYPHKVGKADALRKYAIARRTAPHEIIMNGLRRYIASKPSDRPWCNPATWLHQQRWEDEPAKVVQLQPRKPRDNEYVYEEPHVYMGPASAEGRAALERNRALARMLGV